MPIRVTLDRPAMQALIDRDPEFEVALQKTVLAEVGKRLLSKDSDKIIAQMEPELFAKCLRGMQEDEDMSKLVRASLNKQLLVRSDTWGSTFRLSDQTRALVEQHAAAIRERLLSEVVAAMDRALTDKVQEKLAAALAEDAVEARVEKRVNRLVEEEINRRADEKFKARIADLRGMLA